MRLSFRRAYWLSALFSSNSTPKRCGIGMEKLWLTSGSRLISTSQASTKSRKGNIDLHPTTKQGSQFVGHPATFPSPQDSSIPRVAVSADLTTGKRKPGRSRRFVITTLDPAQLGSSCFLDVSGRTHLYVYEFASPESPYLLHMSYASDSKLPEAFPPDTRGFLYVHGDAHNPLQSQIRFRVTQDSDPTRSFASGHDLTYGSGYTWKLLLANVATRPGVRAMLLRDRLVDNALLAQLQARSASGKHPVRRKRVVSALSDPFTLEFKNTAVYLVVNVTGEDRVYVTRGPLCNDIRMRKASMVYEGGSALCRLERSTLPQHAGRRIVVMRLLKILQPPKRRLDLPSTDGVSVPAEGELFTSWSRDVDAYRKRGEDLKLLYDAADNVGQASDRSS